MTAESITGRRVRHGKGYEHIRREALQDVNLSFKAQGILTYLLSLPDTWKTNSERLGKARPGKEGRDAIRSGLRELEDAGYLRRERTCVAGRWVWHWFYTDNPEDLLDQQEQGVDAGQTMSGLPVDGSEQAQQGVSAVHSMDGLTVDGSSVDIESRDQRDSEEASQDQKIERSADAPSPHASTVDDPRLLPSHDTDPLPPPNYFTEPDEWIEYKAGGLESNERNCMESMLDDDQEPKKILNKILKDREGIEPWERSAVRGNWLPYVRRKVGGWREGERDYARKLLADYHPDVVVGELWGQRQPAA